MKRLIALLGLAAILALPSASTGCRTSGTNAPTVNRIAYNSTASVITAVDHAMKALATYSVTNPITPAQNAQVEKFHAAYQQTLALAIIGVQAAQGDQDAISKAVAGAVAGAAPLLTLIQTLTAH